MSLRDYLYDLATDRIKGPIPLLLKGFLYLFSFLYAIVVRGLIIFSRLRSFRLGCKVISVGNITLGGTGKTTLVQLIAEYLKSNGKNPAILTRGYKKLPKTADSSSGQSLIMGDEPFMLQRNLTNIPVIVDSNRIHSAKKAIQDYKADTVILDDGFQQWRIKKDLEIVAIDAVNPFGNKHLLPRGILREPLCGLKRADVFVLTKTNFIKDSQGLKSFLAGLNPGALLIESEHSPQYFYELGQPEKPLSLETFSGKNAALFSGIGDPDSFEKLASGLGLKVGLSFKFADHYNYSQSDLEGIARQAKERGMEILVTTEKDASRLYELRVTNYPDVHLRFSRDPDLYGIARRDELRIYILRIAIKIITGKERFYDRIHQLYSL
ncbi:MAG: tetraacyldisaccharide 4'-kinase [Candidatus Omnitrophica bacterium]|nr:tetraacyldisaccharide 4'-kinase [Candidatus Omnitrophota bacterium]